MGLGELLRYKAELSKMYYANTCGGAARSIIVSLCAFAGLSHAYDEPVHQDLTRLSFLRSVVALDPSLLVSLGARPYNEVSYPFFRQGLFAGNSSPVGISIVGAHEEDNYNGALSSLTHFYDLQNGRQGLPGPFQSSWQWIGNDANATPFLGSPSDYSFIKSQSYLLNALTGLNPAIRNRNFGLLFQSLGHIAHHIQDMSQPQHVRNEPHIHSQNPVFYLDGYFEVYTTKNLATILARLDTWPSVPVPAFGRLEQYWTGGDSSYSGMADVTAKNFISYRTPLFLNAAGVWSTTSGYAFPSGYNRDGSAYTVTPATISHYSLNRTTSMSAAVSRASRRISDDYRGDTIDLRPVAIETHISAMRQRGPRVFVFEDGDVFWSLYEALLPRAIAFSAGAINHVFRARPTLSWVSGTTWRISNPTSFDLSGTFRIHTEDAGQSRAPTSFSRTTTLTPGGSTNIELSFSQNPQNLILSFQGSVGGESGFTGGHVVPFVPPPVSCNTAISAEGDFRPYTKSMNLGAATGTVSVEFEAYGIPDALTIKRGGVLLSAVSTPTAVSGLFSRTFVQTAGAPQTLDITVTPNANQLTQWTLAVSCPGSPPVLARPRVQVYFATDPSSLSTPFGNSQLQICGIYSARVNGQQTLNASNYISLTSGTNVLVEVSHSDPNCGSGLATPTSSRGKFYYRDNTGKRYLNLGANWVTVQ